MSMASTTDVIFREAIFGTETAEDPGTGNEPLDRKVLPKRLLGLLDD
jgi:hypothetical protein